MTYCKSCGAENADGMQFCVKCGTPLTQAPAPEAWKSSGELGGAQAAPPPPPSGYAPPPSSYPTYTPQQPPAVQFPGQQTGEPMHPAIPAIVSLLFPGIGLLFVPNKAGLGIAIFAGSLVVWGFIFVLSMFLIGLCLIPVGMLMGPLAAVHSYDEAAKASGGRFQPVLFKS